MQRGGINLVEDGTFLPRRSKRLNDDIRDDISAGTSIQSIKSVKKQRGVKLISDSLTSIADKENFHRSRHLAPRSRATRVFAELLVDAATDASDFEISDTDEIPLSPVGILFNQQWLRVDDPNNERYNFKVFEDSL